MHPDSLTPEQLAKLNASKTPEELLAFVKAEGFELTDDQLEAVAGGADWLDNGPHNELMKCPNCGATGMGYMDNGRFCYQCGKIVWD